MLKCDNCKIVIGGEYRLVNGKERQRIEQKPIKFKGHTLCQFCIDTLNERGYLKSYRDLHDGLLRVIFKNGNDYIVNNSEFNKLIRRANDWQQLEQLI